MKKVLALFSVMLLFFSASFANERSESEMRAAAMKVLNTNAARAKSKSTAPTEELKKLKVLPTLRIYGYDSGGFAVVTTDDRFDEVIGYSDTQFTDSMPCGFKWWLEQVDNTMQVSDVQQSTFALARGVKRAYKSSVAPMLTTKWGQDRPYYDNCTFTNEGHTYQCVTGCVATALAQVMNYYKYPSCGTGSYSYNITYNKSFTITFSEDFSQSVYDWDNMLDSYKSYSNNRITDSHTRAVAKLMKDCGVSIHTSYSDKTHGSSSSLSSVDDALKKYFFYDSSTHYYSRSNYTKDEWMNLVYDELGNGRPIIYSGAKDDGINSEGHAFVLHGYDSSGNVYINWGWDGQYDGYYDIDLLNPGTYKYNYRQSMVIAVPANNTVILHDLTISVKGSGSIFLGSESEIEVRNDTQSFKVKDGNDATLKFSPDLGNIVKSVIIDGKDVTSSVKNNEYIINTIIKATSVEVEFVEDATAFDDDYNLYITCYATSSTMTQSGSVISKKIGFAITNSGNKDIYITKIVAKDPNTNAILSSSTNTTVLGSLGGNSIRTLTLSITQDVMPTFELEYSLDGKKHLYVANQYCVLTIVSNDYGRISFAGLSIGTESKQFSIKYGEKATIEMTPNEGCTLSKLMVNSSNETSSVSNNKFIITNINTRTSVIATFDDVSGNRPSIDGHEYVDLGLKSGKCWSIMNYGAQKSEDSGYYSRGTSVNSWGEHWTVPTKDDFQELIDDCEWVWTEKNEIKGYYVIGSNGNKMFLPAAGYQSSVSLFGDGIVGNGTLVYYRTSTKSSDFISKDIILKATESQKGFGTLDLGDINSYPIRPISTIIKEPETTNYNLSITAFGNGSVEYFNETVDGDGTTRKFNVNEGISATLIFKPNSGYQIGSLKINNVDVTSSISNNRFTINNVTSNITVNVTFEAIPPTTHTLIISSSGNGLVTYLGNTINSGTKKFFVNEGAEATLTFILYSGYIIKSLKVNDVDVTSHISNKKYIISGIERDTYIEVVFEKESNPDIQSKNVQYMNLTVNNHAVSFALADKPVLTYKNDVMQVSTSRETVQIQLADLQNWTFSDIATGMIDVRTAKPRLTGGCAYLSQLKPGSQAEVFDMKGNLVLSDTVNEFGEAQLEYGSLPKGVYVIKTSAYTIKITNK